MLDVACGTGLVTLRVAVDVTPEGFVTATDLSEGMLDRAREAAGKHGVENVSFERTDAEALDLLEDPFDEALCSLGLMYVPDPDRALEEMHRLLVPGGRAAAVVGGDASAPAKNTSTRSPHPAMETAATTFPQCSSWCTADGRGPDENAQPSHRLCFDSEIWTHEPNPPQTLHEPMMSIFNLHSARSLLFLLLIPALLGSCIEVSSGQNDDRIAPLLEGMGDHHHPITTDDSMAQRYFDQGLVLAWAFNHAEAARSFREAARRDSSCAMCYWGEALVLGPNINAGMPEENVPKAYAALQEAQRHAPNATEREQAYIEALSARYAVDPPEDRSSLDQEYAEAMGRVAEQYPDDPDAQVLYGEALMDTTPWDYWRENGDPKAVTETILATFESVMKNHPNHPGANHLYIHTVEAQHPERGVEPAERLEDLVPGAGHLVHMPSHIYIRVGRYHDGSLANERAIEADQEYVAQCHAQGLYPVAYIPHNYHFLWATATMEGRGTRAIEAARSMAAKVDTSQMRETGYGTLQHYWITPLYAQVRFGRWDAILGREKPAEDLTYPTAVWHYARTAAFIATDRLNRAEKELSRLRALLDHPELQEVTVWDINTTAHIMKIAATVVAGELAAARGRYADAVRHLDEGVQLEDDLNYDEPPTWHHPVRQTLGAVLLEADRPADAEQAYREDLERFPKNGWSLYGLMQSLRAQGQAQQAAEVEEQFREAWQYADVSLTSSRVLK